MPVAFERGLISFFSTFEVNGIRITVGKPPAKPDLDWARIHMMVADPDYYGKIRVLLYNLRHGVADDPAYRNAFGKSVAEVEAATKKHFAAGNFQTTSISSRPMSEADFPERQVSERRGRTGARRSAGRRAVGRRISETACGHEKVAEAEEGLGLLAVREGHTAEARKNFAAAMEAGSTSARCYIEYAKLEPDENKAEQALLKALGINSKLAEPFALLAKIDTDPRKRVMHWKSAAERDPRNTGLLEDAGRNLSRRPQLWRGRQGLAQRRAGSHRPGRARTHAPGAHVDRAAASGLRRGRKAARGRGEGARDRNLKTQARAELRKAEAKFSDSAQPAGDKAVPWWDGPKPEGKVSGTLKQVDCLPKQQARLFIEDESHKLVKLLVADPSKVVYTGNGEVSLGCGVQKPRKITVAYFPKANARLATAGEVATIDFQ